MFFPVVYTQGVPVTADFYSRLMPPICVNQLTGIGYYIDSTGTVQPLASSLTTPISLANGGTGASLTDPNADRILFWDDSAGAVTWLTAGTGLSISDTTLSVSASSALTLIETKTASASTSIDFTTGISSSYNEYMILASKVILSGSASLNLVVSQDGGSTWKTGASDYAWTGFGYRDATAFNFNSTADARIRLGLNQNVSNGSGPWSGEIRFYIPSDTTLNKMFKWDASQMPPSGTGGTIMRESGAGMFQLNTSAINGIRLIPASSPVFTITTGIFSLYGFSQ